MNVSWPVLLLICGVLIAVVLVLVLPIPRSRTKTSTRADRGPTPTFFRDDDRYWYGGLLYNNPEDPAAFVPKRYGLGWTVNFGHPQGKLFLIAMLLLPLVIALLGTLFPGTPSFGCHPSGCHLFP
ncbi:MAG TPA: DUF5808 domain-containing protein [Ktedonobacteraceae bacterium]